MIQKDKNKNLELPDSIDYLSIIPMIYRNHWYDIQYQISNYEITKHTVPLCWCILNIQIDRQMGRQTDIVYKFKKKRFAKITGSPKQVWW